MPLESEQGKVVTEMCVANMAISFKCISSFAAFLTCTLLTSRLFLVLQTPAQALFMRFDKLQQYCYVT